MSQEKVERYKKEKSNRAKQAAHDKMMFRVEMTGAAVVLALLIGWFSFSVYSNHSQKVAENKEVTTTTMDVSDLQDYLRGLQADSEE